MSTRFLFTALAVLVLGVGLVAVLLRDDEGGDLDPTPPSASGRQAAERSPSRVGTAGSETTTPTRGDDAAGLDGTREAAPVAPSPSEATFSDRARLDVMILDEATSNPLVDVDVELRAAESWARRTIRGRVKTDAEGKAEFASLAPGPYVVRTLQGGEIATVTLAAGDTRIVVLACTGLGPVRGRCVDAAGAPLARADVYLSDHATSFAIGVAVTTTDRNGAFEIPLVAPGRWLQARKAGHAPSLPKRVAAADVFVALALGEATCELGGRVTHRGSPVEKAVVRVREVPSIQGSFDAGWYLALEGASEAEGRFRLAGLRPGEAIVEVLLDEFAAHEERVVLADGANELEVELSIGATIRGEVVDEVGRPVVGAHVIARREKAVSLQGTISDEDGLFTLSHIAPGRTTVTAEAARVGRAEAVLEPAEGTDTWWEARLEIRPGVGGRVVLDDGSPLADVVVTALAVDRAEDPDYWGRAATTDRGGAFFLEGLRPSDHRIEVAARTGKGGTARRIPVAGLPVVRQGDSDLLIEVPADLLPTTYVTGRLDGRGVAIREAALLIRPSDDSNPIPNLPIQDPEGGFRVGPFTPGDHRIEVHTASHGVLILEHRDLRPFDQLDLGIVTLRAPGRITLTLDRDAAAESGRLVSVSVRRDGKRVWFGSTSETSLDIGPLPPGPGTISVSDGRVGRSARFDLAPDQLLELTIALR